MSESETQSLEKEFSRFNTNVGTIKPAEALALFERARSLCPVPHSDELGGFHLFINYEDVRRALLNTKSFSSSPSVTRPLTEEKPSFPPLEYDPPEHMAWRQIFVDGVNAEAAKRIEPQIRADAIQLIEAFAANGSCDLVADLAERIPMNAIFYILGFDAEHFDTVRVLTLDLLASVTEPDKFGRLFAEFAAFGCGEVEKRRANPREDYLTVLANAKMNGVPLSPSEIGAITNSLLIAGHGTTVAAMTNLFFEVLTRPHIRRALIDDPALIPNAVDEGLRLHNPFFGLYRRATEDMTVHDRKITKGESVMMCWQAANRDPAAFAQPNDFRLDRTVGKHLAFGLGRHFCVGSLVAKMEMKTTLEELLKRLPDIELVDPERVEFEFRGAETAAIPALPARFKPRLSGLTASSGISTVDDVS
jgi:cytochrome P450